MMLEEITVECRKNKRPLTNTMDCYVKKIGHEKPKLPMNSKQQKRFDLELVTMLVTTNTSFRFVKTPGFKRFINWVGTEFTVKGCHAMLRDLTPLLTRNVQTALDEVLRRELPTCENVSFAMDKWQSKGEHPYISLTLHYVNKKFVLRKFLIGCKSTEGLTAPAKSAFIKNMVDSIPGLRPKERCSRTMVHDIGMNSKVKKSGLADQQMNQGRHSLV